MKSMSRRGSSFSTDRSTTRAVVVIPLVLTLVLAAMGFTPAPVLAEPPLEVAEAVAIDGVFQAPGRDELDEEAIAESIRGARARGLRLVVVAPNDPQPDPAAFARRVLEASDADAALVFPPEGGMEAYVIDEFESASLRALAAGRSKSDPVVAVEAFTDELLAEQVRTLPPIVGQIGRGVLFLAVALAGAVAIEQLLRRMFPRGRVVSSESSTN